MNKYVVEFIGTFFLMLTVALAAVYGSAGNLAPLAIGSVLMVMIYAGGHISGAHYNPAVTVAVFVRGRCSMLDFIPYLVVQLAGGLAAALVAQKVFEPYLITLKVFDPTKIDARPFELVPIVVAEALFTFALAYVVVNVATAKGTAGNSNYGLAIGFTVLAGAYTVGAISGGVFNPAVAAGLTFLNKLDAANLWVYLVAQLAAGAVAGLLFRILNPSDQ